MKWLLLVTLLFVAACQQLEADAKFREDYRQCLMDRVQLIDKVEVMKTPPVVECPAEVKGVLTPELNDAGTRDKCLYIIDRFGEGTFNEKEQAFRNCWDREDEAYRDRYWECHHDIHECRLDLKLCNQREERKK